MSFLTDKLSINKLELSSLYHIDVSGNINFDGSLYQYGVLFEACVTVKG